MSRVPPLWPALFRGRVAWISYIYCGPECGAAVINPNKQSVVWWPELWRRIRRDAWLKSVGVPAFMALFFVGYFMLADHPDFPVTVMPLTALDHLISFQPWALGLYASLWLYVTLPPALVASRRELVIYGIAALALSLAGMFVFFFWPTATPRPNIDWAHYPSYAFLKTVDQARNACPSLHVAFAVFSGFWLDRTLVQIRARSWLRALSILWGLGIIYSTMATKQHVALDAYAGACLGSLAAAMHYFSLNRVISPVSANLAVRQE